MANPEGPDLSPAEQLTWLKNLLHAAESAVADLRVRNDATQTVLIADLDDLCVHLRDEIAAIKPS